MVSNSHDYDPIVVSKDITSASSSKNTYDLKESDIKDSSSSKVYALSKVSYILSIYVYHGVKENVFDFSLKKVNLITGLCF